MNKKKIYTILKGISKEVCTILCPKGLVDCKRDCKFQKLLIDLVAEIDKG